jgi:hypothetical protein
MEIEAMRREDRKRKSFIYRLLDWPTRILERVGEENILHENWKALLVAWRYLCLIVLS